MMSNEAFNESDQCLLEEIEALKAIFFSEVDVKYTASGRPIELQTTLFPSTADEANQHYVCLTLLMKFPSDYPDQAPTVELRNPRGLGDDFLANVFKKCQEKCSYYAGSPVIYEIIELLRDCLTNSNRPTGHCTICLFDFHTEDVFTYTQCYHHFHSHCLSRFCESMQKQWKEEEDQEVLNNPTGACWRERKQRQFTCPVCREVINVELDSLKQAMPPYEVENFNDEFRRDANFTTWKKKMELEYQKQKAKGGIIDRAAEDNRFLVVTETTSDSSSDLAPIPVEVPPVIEASECPHDQSKSGRGMRFRRHDTQHNAPKERPVPVKSTPCPSNPPAFRGPRNYTKGIKDQQQQPLQTNQRTGGGRQNSKPPNGTRPLASLNRPPPGFEPR